MAYRPPAPDTAVEGSAAVPADSPTAVTQMPARPPPVTDLTTPPIEPRAVSIAGAWLGEPGVLTAAKALAAGKPRAAGTTNAQVKAISLKRGRSGVTIGHLTCQPTSA